MNLLFASGGQSIGASASAPVLPMNIQGLFPLGLTGWFDLLAFQGTFKCLLQHHSSKASILWQSAFFMVQLSHPYTTTRKIIALIMQTFDSKVIFLFFNTVYVCHSFPSKKEASFNFMAAVTFHSDFQKKSVTTSTFSPSICHKVMGPDAMSLSLLNVEFQASFFGLLFHFHQEVLQFFFTFYHQSGTLCLSEVVDISSGNLDSSL